MRSSDGPAKRRRNYTNSCNRRSTPMSDSNCSQTSSAGSICPNTISMVRCPTSPNGNSPSATRNIIRWAREEGLTIRQIYQRFAAARGQRTLIGSPSYIADNMEEWFRGYGVDGFLFHPSHLPGGLDDFVALVIPELQSRGLFRAEYEGTTLRENMELERPKSRYVSN